MTERCPACNGLGHIRLDDYGVNVRICWRCNGTGLVDNNGRS